MNLILDTNLATAPRGGAARVASAIAMQIDDMRYTIHLFIEVKFWETDDSGKRRSHGRAADALAQEAEEGRGKPR